MQIEKGKVYKSRKGQAFFFISMEIKKERSKDMMIIFPRV